MTIIPQERRYLRRYVSKARHHGRRRWAGWLVRHYARRRIGQHERPVARPSAGEERWSRRRGAGHGAASCQADTGGAADLPPGSFAEEIRMPNGRSSPFG